MKRGVRLENTFLREFKSKTQYDLINMLYPKEYDELNIEYLGYIEKFYERRNILPILNYIMFKRIEVFNESNEKNKIELDFLIANRLKDLFCRYGEYEKALFVYNREIDSYIERRIKEGDIKALDIPIIANELISRVNVYGNIDDQIYNVLKIIPIDKLYYTRYSKINLEENKTYYYSCDEAQFFKSLIPFLKETIKNEDYEIFEKYALFLMSELFVHFQIFYNFGDEGIWERVKDTYLCFNELGKIIYSSSSSLFTIKSFELYSYSIEMYLNKSKIIKNTNIIKMYTIKEFEKVFLNYLKEIKYKLFKTYMQEIIYVFQAFEETVYDLTESYGIFVEGMSKKIKDRSIPKYKKTFIKEYLMEPKYIPTLFEKKQYELIASIYFEEKNHIRLEEHYWEIAKSLIKCQHVDEALKVYKKVLGIGVKDYRIYKEIGSIYQYYYNDINKAREFYSEIYEGSCGLHQKKMLKLFPILED